MTYSSFTLDNSSHGNEVTGVMFDAMLAELRKETSKPRARVLRIQARGNVFCTGRERAGRTPAAIRRESARIIKFKAALRSSPLISIAEVQGNAFGFGFGLAIVCDFALVAEHASLGFPEMRSGLAPVAILSYLGEYTIASPPKPTLSSGVSCGSTLPPCATAKAFFSAPNKTLSTKTAVSPLTL